MTSLRSPAGAAARCAGSAFVVAVALLAGAPGSAQAPQDTAQRSEASQGTADQPAPRPTFRAEANFVRVDVFPTKDGLAVRDLALADFELLEDGVLQKIETFEHVEIRGQVPTDERREPNTVSDARAAAEDPRSRVFVIFLDTYHTDVGGSHRMRTVLIDLLNRIVGPDDLFAVMTPEMSARDVTFARRTETMEGYLARYWNWGRRDQLANKDPEEQEYESCFGLRTDVTREMIARRREKRVLDALTDLSIYLRGVREERKAVITITDGWVLYRDNPRLADANRAPQGPRVGMGPDGRITTDVMESQGGFSRQGCDADRMNLAHIDNWQTYRDLLDLANRSNVSFYPIDSRGLPASDAPIYEDVPPAIDQRVLANRIDNLRTLAEVTDGLAVTDSNNIERGVRRIVDDLTSYYLLGYYSSNTKPDGRYRSIKVKVKRPGVDVRARRGYKAASEKEITEGRAAATAAAAVAPPSAFQAAMGALAAARPDFRFLTSVSWIAAPLDDSVPGAKSQLWVTGELDEATARGPEWAGGATAEILLTAEDGVKIVEQSVPVPAPVRAVSVALPDVAIGPGDYALRLRIKPAAGGLPFMDTVRFTVSDSGDLVGKPRMLRRGPSTGTQFVVTADPRYRRTDRIRVEVPMLGAIGSAGGELLDRNGRVLPVPVQTSTRDEEAGLKWASAEAALAPLAPGDYALRATITRGSRTDQVVTAFRVVP
jgi:VWFA-related protein